MIVRMVHPVHGATHAYDQGEVDRLKKLGWDVEKPAIPTAADKRKPGRPPKAK